MLYIEPVPEHPEAVVEGEGRPDALENSLAALLKLPRYETIREDLKRILENNRLAGRIERINRYVELDKHRSSWVPHYAGLYDAWLKRKQRGGRAGPEPRWARHRLTDEE